MPATASPDLIAIEIAAPVKACHLGYTKHLDAQADRIGTRDQGIIAKNAKGWTVKDIARDVGISDGHVRHILIENGVTPRTAQPIPTNQPTVNIIDYGSKDAKIGSADLLNAIMSYYLRRGESPPTFDADSFIARCRSLKIHPAIIERGVETALRNQADASA